jgi:hypothetical protein
MDRTGTPITIAAPSAQGAEFPHMLKQRNYATAGPAEPPGSSTDVLEGIVVSGDAPPTAPPAADK